MDEGELFCILIAHRPETNKKLTANQPRWQDYPHMPHESTDRRTLLVKCIISLLCGRYKNNPSFQQPFLHTAIKLFNDNSL